MYSLTDMKRTLSNALSSVLLLAVIAGLTGIVQTPGTAEPDLTSIVEKLRSGAASRYWSRASELYRTGKDDPDELRTILNDTSPLVRIAGAYALYRSAADHPDQEESLKEKGLTTLLDITESESGSPRIRAADAIWYLSRGSDAVGGSIEQAINRLESVLSSTETPAETLSVSRALYGVSGFSLRAVEALKDLADHEDPDVRFQAAVALARMDAVSAARPVLERFSKQPTERGKLAQVLLDKIKLTEDLERIRSSQSRSSSSSYPVIDEVIEKINTNYVDMDKVDRKTLIEGAAKGIMNQLDPFSKYLSKQQLKTLTEGLNRKYEGIGAIVSMREGYLTIEQPIYSGPAYEAGLRTNDQIVEVEGESTYEKELRSLVKKLKGKPGSEVSFKVMRRGWTEPKTFTIKRARIDVKTAKHRMLPGKIGYIKIITFGSKTKKEVRKAIESLKSQGAQSMIVDVRNNSGGYLPSALKICDYFLDPRDEKGDRQMILSVRGNGEDRKYYVRKKAIYHGPLAVLANGGSASASEIFSGALQDHGRATVIGEKTFGKGSVQKLFYLDSQDGAALKLTQAKYYLPSGRTPHRTDWKADSEKSDGGISPDVTIQPDEESFWFAYASENVLESGKLKKYYKKHKANHLSLFKKLARYDGGDWKKYPEFESLYKSLDTKLNRNRIRRLLRQTLRRNVADSRGQAFVVDYQSDIQVRRAILDVLNKREEDPNQYKPYVGLKKEIQKHSKQEQETLPGRRQ